MNNIKMQIRKIKATGFTLIEMLVVISIIGILATLVSANLNSVRGRARDTQRKSDLMQFRNSLENYANTKSGLYPIYSSPTVIGGSSALCTILGQTTCPEDPKGSSYNTYQYVSDETGTKYVLWSLLESAANGTYWVVCSGGSSGEVKSGIPPVRGVCPI